MSESKPLFSLGEEVIVDSKINPIFNGEQVISSVSFKRLGKDGVVEYKGWAYQVEVQTELDKWYYEPSIKKKHKPSDLGFKELMSSLSSPITKEQLVENKN